MATELYYSGGPDNKFANGSIGGSRSTTKIPNASIENLFDDVNRVEVINGRIEYRCFFIVNEDAQDYYRTKFEAISIPTDTEIAFAVDNVNGLTPQLLTTEDTTPVGLSFFAIKDWIDLEIPIGMYPQTGTGNAIPIWIRRKVLVGSDNVRTIALDIDAENDALSITQDFHTKKSSFDNYNIFVRSDQFFTDIDFCGEALLS